MFGPEARVPKATLLKDWAADPLTATAPDQVAADHPSIQSESWVPERSCGNLFLTGSETSPADPGYLSGAIVAAKSAAGAIPSESNNDLIKSEQPENQGE